MPIVKLKNQMKKSRNPFLVWSMCYLWFISLYSIVWSMFLFLTIRETLWVTGTDLVNLFVLLSGLFLLPANIQMLSRVANGVALDSKTSILCCPLWLYLSFMVLINLTGAALCARKIYRCRWYMNHLMTTSMRLYKTTPVYKNFMDNVQWTLKCCGVRSYVDWFTTDWFDQIHDYDWDEKIMRNKKDDGTFTDSVPLSCCKSGTCYPNYLTELGANSVNKNGCARVVYRILIVLMTLHLIVFCSIALVEVAILYCSFCRKCDRKSMQLLSVNDNYRDSSNSRSKQLTDATTTEPTDSNLDLSDTDLSVLEHSISEIRKSLDDCAIELCGKRNRYSRGSQIESPNQKHRSPVRCPDPCESRHQQPDAASITSRDRSKLYETHDNRCPNPQYPQCTEDEYAEDHALDNDYEQPQQMPCRPCRSWRLSDPGHLPFQSSSKKPSQPDRRSPPHSHSNSPCWSVDSRQQQRKVPEVKSPRPSVLSITRLCKKRASMK